MKKLVLGLAAVTVSAASADTRTGFYLGTNISANVLYTDIKIEDSFIDRTKNDLGDFGVGGGVYLGYGKVCGNMYYAGELAYQYNSAAPGHTYSFTGQNTTTNYLKIKIENKHKFNFAGIIGYRATPFTVWYARLGGNVSQVEMKAKVNENLTTKLHKEKTRVSFEPGLGVESSIGRNLMMRLEYTHDFGNGVKKHSHVDGSEGKARAKSVNTHSAKLGVAYKF